MTFARHNLAKVILFLSQQFCETPARMLRFMWEKRREPS